MLAETFNHCNLTAIASAVFTTTKINQLTKQK